VEPDEVFNPLILMVRSPVFVIAVLSVSNVIPAPAFNVMDVTPEDFTYPESLVNWLTLVGISPVNAIIPVLSGNVKV